MKTKLALLGAAMLAAGSANAQSFTETFDGKTIANLQSSGWSFSGAPAFLAPGVGDLALLFNASATFSFTVTNTTPFYLVSFFASRPTSLDTNYLDVYFKRTDAAGLDLKQTFTPLPTAGLFGGADPLGTRFSYYFGSPVTPGTYSLRFDNGPGVASTVTIDSLSISAVPEPETYALMLAGLGMAGFMARRRKSDSTGAALLQGAAA